MFQRNPKTIMATTYNYTSLQTIDLENEANKIKLDGKGLIDIRTKEENFVILYFRTKLM